MTITFEDDKDVIVYTLEKIIAFARSNQYIFLVQSVWWISSIIGLQEGLITYMDNLNVREQISKPEPRMEPLNHLESSGIHPERITNIQNYDSNYCSSERDSVSTLETDIHNELIEHGELFLEQSKQERKAIRRKPRQVSRAIKKRLNKVGKKKASMKTFGTQTEGIDGNELR
jgi:hypothetical protein